MQNADIDSAFCEIAERLEEGDVATACASARPDRRLDEHRLQVGRGDPHADCRSRDGACDELLVVFAVVEELCANRSRGSWRANRRDRAQTCHVDKYTTFTLLVCFVGVEGGSLLFLFFAGANVNHFDIDLSPPPPDSLRDVAVVAASATAATFGRDSESESDEPLSLLGRHFVGDYATASPSPQGGGGSRLDFERVCLAEDGTYTAKVEATLLNPSVRSFGASCTLPEHGEWNAFMVKGKAKLRVRPTTGRARVYGVARNHDTLTLTLSRRGESATLVLTSATSAKKRATLN